MSLQSEIKRLQENVESIASSKDAIFIALTDRGVAIPQGATLHDVPALIGKVDGSAPPSTAGIAFTFRFANSNFSPTSVEQIVRYKDADCWKKVIGSLYNDWKYTAKSTSLKQAFEYRFTSTPVTYGPDGDVPGITEVLATEHTEKITNLSDTFIGCVDLSWTPDFDVSSVTDCKDAFGNCVSLNGYQMYVRLSAIPGIVYNTGTFKYVRDEDLIPYDWGGSA